MARARTRRRGIGIHTATVLLISMGSPTLAEIDPPARIVHPPRFEVKLGPGPRAPADGGLALRGWPPGARLLVVLGRAGDAQPRLSIGRTGMDADPLLGRDVGGIDATAPAILDEHSALFPLDRLGDLKAGEYAVQALLHTNPDLNHVNAPGDLYSSVATVRIDGIRPITISLELSRSIPAESLPDSTELVRYIKIRSRKLTEFHGRPIDLRAGVILPRDHAREPDRRYPLRVHIGGYGARFMNVGRMMEPTSAFRRAWTAADAPRMILVHLDGAGPLGDPYQIDSANHGPYGAAVTEELIPYIERTYRGLGRGTARVLDGGSTGGWVALALQVFYPDFFNGAWAFCPDSVDFRSFQLLNLHEDENAYVNEHGFERPSARDPSGDVRYTMRHECRLENVLGAGDSWTLSGGQWGAWNSTYGARGADGRPVPIWDPITGKINHAATAHWDRYDLRLILENNWADLGPRLKGKLHIWVGDADDFFLNNAVRRLDAFLSKASPPFDGSIKYAPGEGHCWIGITEAEMMNQMARRMAVPLP